MIDYRLIPIRAWFRRDLAVERDGDRVALIERAPLRTRATIELDGRQLELCLEGRTGERAQLRGAAEPAGIEASGRRECAGPAPRWCIQPDDGSTLVFTSRSKWSDEFRLTDGDRELARLERESPLTRVHTLGLADDLPLPIGLFAAFLYLQYVE